MGAGVAVEQYQQPGPDIADEAGGQLAAAVVDPGTDRRDGVVMQQLQVGEHVGDPDTGGVWWCSSADLGERDGFTDRVAVEHHGQAVHRASDGGTRPPVGLAELFGAGRRRSQREVVRAQSWVLPALR